MEKNSKIPSNYQTVMPYLITKGAEQFIDFLKNVFDATETYRVMKDEHTVMHAEVMIGECTLMLADSTDRYGSRTAGMFVYVDDADLRFKKAIDAGASIINPVSDQPYGRSGRVTDPFGNSWWITSLK
jgi:PhnB protein